MRRTLFIALALWAFLPQPHARAEEPFEQFLDALREGAGTNRAKWGGQLDLALKYLDRIAVNRSVSKSIREQVDFRRGVIYVARARAVKNPTLRQQSLDAAEQSFEDFLRDHPRHRSSGTARGQLGNVVVERARSLMKQAADGGANAEQLRQKASDIFDKAEDLLEQSRVDLAAQLDGLKAAREPADVQRRTELRSEYVAAKLARARVLFEHADAVASNEKKYRQKLTEAAAAFDDIAQKYRKVSAGVYAILYEGQCYQRMGEDKRALSYFKELLQLPGKSPGIRKLKTQALTFSITSWLAEGQNGHDVAIDATTKWLKTTRGNEDVDPNWLALKLALARAYYRKSIAEENKKKSERALSEARQLARELSTRRGAHQREAQELLVKLGRGKDADTSDTAAALASQDFDAALTAAKRSLDAMKVAGAAVKIMSSQLEKISDPTQREEIEARLTLSQDREQELRVQTLELFEHADQLATEDDLNEWNSVRYYLSFLYYTQRQYRRAAVLADFVASRYPESIAARECANVALAAYQELYRELPEADRARQSARIGRIAEVMISNWPGQSQANNALTTLLNVTVRDGDLEKAESYLARIPTDSPSRASAELRTGQAIWREYLKAVTAGQDDAAEAPLEEMRRRSEELLAKGLARLDRARPDDTVIRSALSLAQIYVESGQATKAIELLNHPRYGPLTLVEQGNAVVQRISGIGVETYKLAIRAHVASAGEQGEDAESSLEEAQRILTQLRKQLEDQPNGRQTMIQIYVGLAGDLERQLATASPDAKRALSRGFESFVRGAGQSSEDVTVLNWVAETLFSMGKGFQLAGKETSESKRYFREAAAAYGRVLKLARSQRDALSDNLLTQVRTRRAVALRATGDFQQAVDLFAQVLSSRAAIVNIQAEAAKTLQAWGTAGETDGYLKAVRGARPLKSGKNAIWGWARLAAVVGRPELMAKNAAYRDTFYDARYNIALCHYRYALQTPDRKQAYLKRAKQDIIVTNKLYRLDSSRTTKRFESLLKEVQKRLGEPAIGFAQPATRS